MPSPRSLAISSATIVSLMVFRSCVSAAASSVTKRPAVRCEQTRPVLEEFRKRGIIVYGNIERELGEQVLRNYVAKGKIIYKPSRQDEQ